MIWQGILFLLGLSFFTSKSGLGIFSLLAIFGSFWKLNFKQLWHENRNVFYVVLLYPLLFVLNFLSLDGPPSSLIILHAWAWPLIVLPTVVLFQSRKDLKSFLSGALISLLIAIGYCYYLLAVNDHFDLARMDRLYSFWDTGRWGVFLGSALIFLIGFTGVDEFKLLSIKKVWLYRIFLFLTVITFVLSKTRGPFVGVLLALILFSIGSSRLRKTSLLSIVLMVIVVLLAPNMKARVTSIADVQVTDSGVITAGQVSNSARLHMWKVALDFFKEQPWFGTGYDSTGVPLRKFIEKQSEEYRKIYTSGEFSYNDQHSSYLNFLVQNGVIFFVTMMLLFFKISMQGIQNYFRTRSTETLIALAILLAYYVIFFFYATLQSYDSVFFFMALAYLASLNSKKETA